MTTFLQKLWKNRTDSTLDPGADPALNADNMNRIEQGITDAVAATNTNATDLTTHEGATTSVHGIVDTSALETATGAQAKADAAQAAAEAASDPVGSAAAAQAASDPAGTAASAVAALKLPTPVDADDGLALVWDKVGDAYVLQKPTAGNVSIADAGGYFAGSNAEDALQELGPLNGGPVVALARNVTPEMFGAVGDGSTDDTAAILDADAYLQANGGTLLFSAGKTYLCLGCLVLSALSGPDVAPTQKPRRWTSSGGGPAWSGRWAANVDQTGAARLDLRYDGGDGLNAAKIDTRGSGYLEIDHLAILGGQTNSNFPIIQTTNTTVHVHHNYFKGNYRNTRTTCQQDAIVLGGSTTTIGPGKTDAFQGYGSVIEWNFFDYLRRGVVYGTYANNIPVRNNTFSMTCGSNLATGGAIDIGGEQVTGAHVYDNTIEMSGYPYGVYVGADQNVVGPNGYYDAGAGISLGAVYCSAAASKNLIIDGFRDGAIGLLVEDSSVAGQNRTLSAISADGPTYAPSGLTGATAASRYVGGTSYGPPTSGTFAVGDFIIDESGFVWICKSAGSPGTWTEVVSIDPLARGVGFVNWNNNLGGLPSSSYASLTAGTVYFSMLYLPPGKTISNLHLATIVSPAGSAPTSGIALGLATTSGKLVAQTDPSASAFAGPGVRMVALTAPYTTNPTDAPLGCYYMVALQIDSWGVTQPGFLRGNAASALGNPRRPGGGPILYGTGVTTSQSALPANGSSIAGGTTYTNGSDFWVAAS